jgi:hypothetical protein
MKNVEKSANSLSPSIRFKPVNYQQDPKYQKEPVYEEQEFHGNIEPHNFGPQPVDYEPEQADIFPSAPASFLSVDSADLELSPEGQGKKLKFICIARFIRVKLAQTSAKKIGPA